MKKEFSVALLLFIGLYSYSQGKKLPAGWDLVLLDDKIAYMNLITGTVSKIYPIKAAVKPLEKLEFDPTITHKVKKGETLSTIARKYNLQLARLYRLNSITNFDTLKIGQEIVIGYGQSEAEKAAFFNKSKNTLNSKYAKRFKFIVEKEPIVKKVKKPVHSYHVVAEGETLYGISVYYRVSIDVLKTLNKLKDNTIFMEQKLRIK